MTLYVDPVSIPVNYDYVYRDRVSPCARPATTQSTAAQHHFGWDNSIAPAERVAPGSTILFHCHDSSAGQLGPSSTVADVTALDFGKINPVSGPIFVEGAAAGRRAEGDHRQLCAAGAGRQGLGLDGEHSGLRAARRPVHRSGAACLELRSGQHGTRACTARTARVPLKPFAGTIGNALAETGPAFGRAAAPGRRQSRHPRSGGRHHALSAGRGRGRLVQRRRHPCRTGRRRGLRHRHRKPDGCGPDARSGEGREPEDAALHHAGAGDAASRRQGL